MITIRCNACHRDGPADADRCAACGAAHETVVTQLQPLQGLGKPASSGAIWLDDLTLPPGQADPTPTAAKAAATPLALAITLLEVEAGTPASAQRSVASALPRAEALVRSDREPRPLPAFAPAVAGVASQSIQPNTVRAKRKAERRAAVRRSRLRGKPAEHGASTITEVLVFDAHDGDRDRLCSLLRDFGFGVRATGRADEASSLAASHTFVAAFVDIVPDAADGSAGLDLCQQVRASGGCRRGTDTLLILTATRLTPMDRVRAELAGCEETLVKPVTRGSVAGVLDSHGIALPIDRRQC
jgi:CheY-like chemotaxis protein